MNQTQWLIIIICAVVFSLMVRIIFERFKSRREKPLYRAVSDALNFTLSENVDTGSLPRRNDFFLFTRKDSEHIPYMLSGTVDQVEVRILDFVYSRYKPSAGSQRRETRQTLVMFQAPDFRWPDMRMMPDSFALKLTKMLGVKDIDLDDAPEFSKRYLLNGSDEAAIRRIFRQEVTDAFVRQKGWCLEAHGDVIVFWRNRVRVPPNKILPLLEETIELLQLLTRT